MNHNLRSFVEEIHAIVRPGCSISPSQLKEHKKSVAEQCLAIENGTSSAQPSGKVLQLIDEAYKELTPCEIAQVAQGSCTNSKYAPVDKWANMFFGTFIG